MKNTFKNYILAALLALATTTAYAACVSNTIVGPKGDIVICTTCCMGGSCTTTCV